NYVRQSQVATSTIPGFGTTEEGVETIRQFGLGASWTPTRTSRIGCDAYSERRRNPFAAEQLNVSSNALSCYAQLTVQPYRRCRPPCCPAQPATCPPTRGWRCRMPAPTSSASTTSPTARPRC